MSRIKNILARFALSLAAVAFIGVGAQVSTANAAPGSLSAGKAALAHQGLATGNAKIETVGWRRHRAHRWHRHHWRKFRRLRRHLRRHRYHRRHHYRPYRICYNRWGRPYRCYKRYHRRHYRHW